VAFKKLDNKTPGPLLRLELEIKVEGSFPALLKFAHGLETASDLMLIRSFSIAAGENGGLELRLAADSYLTP
jgi:Tfp pilus assembly protein PilO